MSRRRKIIIVLGCGVLMIAAFLFFHNSDEPYYKGRTLTTWVVSYAQDTNEMAATAISQMGTNAIPFLLKWIQDEPSPTNKMWLVRINSTINWIENKLGVSGDWTIKDRDLKRADAGAMAFRALGHCADFAIPELTFRLNHPEKIWTAVTSAEALAFLGKPGLEPLTTGINSTNRGVRQIALISLKSLGTNALPALPLLLEILRNETDKSASTAARTLGQLKLDPDQVTPALAKALSSKDAATRDYSGRALVEFGPLARPAIPALTNMLSSSDEWEQRVATYLLHVIDPKQFTNTIEPGREGAFRHPIH